MDDRTTPMRQPQQQPQGGNLDDQETVYAEQNNITPPTIPLGDRAGWDQGPDQAFVRTSPAGGVTPQPYQRDRPYSPPPGQQEPAARPDQTLLIDQRPTPVFAWLVVVDGPVAARGDIGRVHTLHADTTSIGRGGENHIALHDETCSNQHAKIRIEAQEEGEPAYVLYDLGSRNGTLVGTRESLKDKENRKYRHELQDGDYLLVGETTLVFKKL